jgi:hypothetical protein
MKSKAVAAGMGDTKHEAVESEKTQVRLANAPSLEEICLRAYELHLEKGCAHGRDLEDWLQAERELAARQPAV